MGRALRLATLGVPVGGGGAATYTDRILSRFGSDVIGYWPLAETSGTAAQDVSGHALHGTYKGTITFNEDGIGDGGPSIYLSGDGPYIALPHAAISAALDEGEFTLSIWFKIVDTVWADATRRRLFTHFALGGNWIDWYKSTTTNQFNTVYTAGGVERKPFLLYGQQTWINIAVTVSKTADEYKIYQNGTLRSTLDTLGTWAGNSIETRIGSISSDGAVTFKGHVAHVLLLNGAKGLDDVQYIAALNSGPPEIMLTFDDGGIESHTNIFPLMAERNIPGTIYATSDWVESSALYCTVDNLLEMDAAGWSIGNHSKTHPHFERDLTQGEIETELAACQAALDAWGLTKASRHVAYPFGNYGEKTLAAMSATGMLTGRTVLPGAYSYADVNKYTGLAKLQTWQFPGCDSPVSYVTAQVDEAIRQNKVGCFLFHRIVVDDCTLNRWTTAEFEQFLDYVVSTGVRCITINDFYDKYVQLYGT